MINWSRRLPIFSHPRTSARSKLIYSSKKSISWKTENTFSIKESQWLSATPKMPIIWMMRSWSKNSITSHRSHSSRRDQPEIIKITKIKEGNIHNMPKTSSIKSAHHVPRTTSSSQLFQDSSIRGSSIKIEATEINNMVATEIKSMVVPTKHLLQPKILSLSTNPKILIKEEIRLPHLSQKREKLESILPLMPKIEFCWKNENAYQMKYDCFWI